MENSKGKIFTFFSNIGFIMVLPFRYGIDDFLVEFSYKRGYLKVYRVLCAKTGDNQFKGKDRAAIWHCADDTAALEMNLAMSPNNSHWPLNTENL